MVQDYCFSTVRAPVALSYFTASVSLVLSFIITAGNTLIFLAIYLDPYQRLRNPFCYFLLSLAVSDFIVGSVAMPVSFWFHFREAQNQLQKNDKILLHLTFFITSTSSVLSMAALCFDRYMAVKEPVDYRKKLTRGRCAVIAGCIWLFSVALSMFYFLTDYILLLMICVHTSLAVTLGMMLLTYRKVYITLNTMSVKGDTPKPIDKKEKSKEKKKRRNARREKVVTRTFLTLLILFFGCYFPVVIMIYILQFCTQCSCTFRHVLRDLEFVIICANSAINPMACVLCLRAYRESVLSILRCAKSEDYPLESSREFESESQSANTCKRSPRTRHSVDGSQKNSFLSPGKRGDWDSRANSSVSSMGECFDAGQQEAPNVTGIINLTTDGNVSIGSRPNVVIHETTSVQEQANGSQKLRKRSENAGQHEFGVPVMSQIQLTVDSDYV